MNLFGDFLNLNKWTPIDIVAINRDQFTAAKRTCYLRAKCSTVFRTLKVLCRPARLIAIFSCAAIAFTACAQGISVCITSISSVKLPVKSKALKDHQVNAPAFTTRPSSIFYGSHPSKSRGRGMWKPSALEQLSCQGLYASTKVLATARHPESVLEAPGSTLPWEGGSATASGTLNTGNGNNLTSLHLFSWKQRGGMTVDFTLYQNSENSYVGELGNNWSWSFNDYLNLGIGTVTVHYGNALAIPFTGSGPSFTPPTGIHDRLVQNSDSTYTLTKLDGTTYQYNPAGYCTSITDRNGNAITLTLNAVYRSENRKDDKTIS